jgi:hypothetical protein
MVTMHPGSHSALSNELNDEGYSDNEPRLDSVMQDSIQYDPDGDLPPPSSLPDFVTNMPEVQRAGTSIKRPTGVAPVIS